MKRREFLISSLGTPLFIRQLLANQSNTFSKYQEATEKSFEFLEVKGTYKQIGYQIGRYFGKNIKQVIKQRAEWHRNLLTILESPQGQLRSTEYLRLTKKHFPHILDEIRGMADGAGLHFDAVWAMCIKSELGALEEEPDGCSTIFTKDQHHMWLFHNEDGNDAYREIMFILKVIPPSGVSYLSLVYPGIITGNGPSMNNRGIIQTTNYIGSIDSEAGFPRYILGRAVLEAKDLNEAVDLSTMEPRAEKVYFP
jgi:predicted choloylglycine hydrolase